MFCYRTGQYSVESTPARYPCLAVFLLKQTMLLAKVKYFGLGQSLIRNQQELFQKKESFIAGVHVASVRSRQGTSSFMHYIKNEKNEELNCIMQVQLISPVAVVNDIMIKFMWCFFLRQQFYMTKIYLVSQSNSFVQGI